MAASSADGGVSGSLDRKGDTFSHEPELPSLPVPPLAESITALRHSVSALFNLPKSKQGHAATARYQEFRRRAAEFEADPDQGPALQALLEQRGREKRNWLDEWWLDNAYLLWPEPVACNTTYQMTFDPELIPPLRDGEAFQNYHPAAADRMRGKRQSSSPGEACATAASVLIASLTDYADMLLHEELPAETVGKRKLCMNQYRQVFTTYRHAGEKGDRLQITPFHDLLERGLYIVVFCRGLCYKVELATHKHGSRASVRQFRKALRVILKDSSRSARGDSERGLGLLTADARPRLARNVEALNGATDGQFGRAQAIIAEALFVVCLDPEVHPSSDVETVRQVYAGDAKNRWYDKVIQICVFGNGRAGLVGEHSPMDAGVVTEVIDWCLCRIRDGAYSDDSAGEVEGDGALSLPERLDFGVTKDVAVKCHLRAMKADAKSTHSAMKENSDAAVLKFGEFGSDWLRTAKVAPDSFFQLALQLTWFRLYGRLCATYETASTRKFFFGRTDVCRSATPEALSFARAMVKLGPRESRSHVRDLMNLALAAHRTNMIAGVNGKAIDRHLMGLRMIAKERAAAGGPPVPAFLEDECVAESSNWRLSTSTVLADTFIPAFAAVVEDGIGLCYAMRAKEIKLCIMSFKSCRQTSSSKFKIELLRSLRDLRDLLVATNEQAESKAKL